MQDPIMYHCAYVTMTDDKGRKDGHIVGHKRTILDPDTGYVTGTYIGTNNERNDMSYEYLFDSGIDEVTFHFFMTDQNNYYHMQPDYPTEIVEEVIIP